MSKEAMKLALEALEAGEYYIDDLEAIVYGADDLGTHEDREKMQAAITALREALAEQPAQQEPVEWGVDWGRAGDIPCVSIIKRLPDGRIEVVAVEYGPQRTWVGLTLEDMETTHWSPDFRAGAKWAAAKLKEKNT